MKPKTRKQENAVIKSALTILRSRMHNGKIFNCAESVADYLMLELGEQEREIFRCLFLDSQLHLIADENMFYGSIRSSYVHPREIVKRGLKLNASALIVAHNHPSGTSKPSDADRKLTKDIRSACDLVEINLLDHIVIGCGEMTSFAQLGQL